MNKTQTQKFALKVQGAISKKFTKLDAAEHKEKMDFLAIILKEGKEFHPDAIHLINNNLRVSLIYDWKKSLSREELAKLKYQNNLSAREIPHPEINFDEHPIMISFYWATDFKFCLNVLKKFGFETTDLICSYEIYILKNGNTQLSSNELDKYIYTYFVNKIIDEFPELIIKPLEPKSSRSIILPDYKAR